MTPSSLTFRERRGGTPSAYVMAAGWRNDAPWILEITPAGMIGHYADIGFHAIGSGAPMAQQAGSLLSHFHLSERSLRFGCAAVLRVLQALDLSSPSVGKPFSLCRINAEGAHHLSEEEIEEVAEIVRRWGLPNSLLSLTYSNDHPLVSRSGFWTALRTSGSCTSSSGFFTFNQRHTQSRAPCGWFPVCSGWPRSCGAGARSGGRWSGRRVPSPCRGPVPEAGRG